LGLTGVRFYGATMKCLLLIAVLFTAAQSAGPIIPPLNVKVVKFAEEHKGKQVGNGECWTLAAEALTNAGAQRPGADGVGVLIFGRKLGAKEGILPGDIAQFVNAEFVHKDPAGKAPPVTVVFPTHSGIVSKVVGKDITMLHQNFTGSKNVTTIQFNLADRTGGQVDFFRPLPAKAKS
jgi:hypothetical protein